MQIPMNADQISMSNLVSSEAIEHWHLRRVLVATGAEHCPPYVGDVERMEGWHLLYHQ